MGVVLLFGTLVQSRTRYVIFQHTLSLSLIVHVDREGYSSTGNAIDRGARTPHTDKTTLRHRTHAVRYRHHLKGIRIAVPPVSHT